MWFRKTESIEKDNYEKLQNFKEQHEQWVKEKVDFYLAQSINNKKLDILLESFKVGDAKAVEWYSQLALEAMQMPIDYDRIVTVEYTVSNKMLIVELYLPIVEDIPKLKSVSYIKIKNEYNESCFPDTYIKKKYDDVIYQIVLLSINTIFKLCDQGNLIDAIVLNGRVNTIDKATGKAIDPCVLSVNITRESFHDLNLNAIDPKAWFRSVKGVSATSFTKVTPIAPIISMSREDDRFIDGYSVAETIDSSVNLAAMDWQDFENFIREVFEYEFNTNGGEVKNHTSKP
jgi:restriction system protein